MKARKLDKVPLVTRRNFLRSTAVLLISSFLNSCSGLRLPPTDTPPSSPPPTATPDETFLIVTDPWEPYIFDVGAPQKGIDYEITEAVFREMGIPVRIEFYPFKRCLKMVEDKDADAILDLIITPERESFLFFPEEHISASPTTAFFRRGEMPEYDTLAELEGYVMGVQLGYEYPDEVTNAPLTKDETKSTESNLQKLLLERVDVVIANRAIALYKAHEMGILDQIEYDPRPLGNEEAKYYLGFAKKPGYDQLAEQFSAALQTFKTRDEYYAILARYGQ